MVVRRNRATHWLPTTGTLFGCGPDWAGSLFVAPIELDEREVVAELARRRSVVRGLR